MLAFEQAVGDGTRGQIAAADGAFHRRRPAGLRVVTGQIKALDLARSGKNGAVADVAKDQLAQVSAKIPKISIAARENYPGLDVTVDGVKWAKPAVTTSRGKPTPSGVSQVLSAGDVIYVDAGFSTTTAGMEE